jgi:hypothetical protein
MRVYPSGQWLSAETGANVRSVELRPTSTKRSGVLQDRLVELVLARQALRDQRAAKFVLEQNRLEIVQTQLELSDALVSEHRSASAA